MSVLSICLYLQRFFCSLGEGQCSACVRACEWERWYVSNIDNASGMWSIEWRSYGMSWHSSSSSVQSFSPCHYIELLNAPSNTQPINSTAGLFLITVFFFPWRYWRVSSVYWLLVWGACLEINTHTDSLTMLAPMRNGEWKIVYIFYEEIRDVCCRTSSASYQSVAMWLLVVSR